MISSSELFMCTEREAGIYPAEANCQAPLDTILHRHTANWHAAQKPAEKNNRFRSKTLRRPHQVFAPKKGDRKQTVL